MSEGHSRHGGGGGPSKVVLDSPFTIQDIVISTEKTSSVLTHLAEIYKEVGTKYLLIGVNEVARGLQANSFCVVFVTHGDHPPVLTDHLKVSCFQSSCRLAQLAVTSQALGKSVGKKRALVVGLKKEVLNAELSEGAKKAVSGVMEVASSYEVPWLKRAAEKMAEYSATKTTSMESHATEETKKKRELRKRALKEKQQRLKQMQRKKNADKKQKK